MDRLVRTLQELIERYYDILGNRKESLQDGMDSIIATDNNDNHRSLQNITPNQVFNDYDKHKQSDTLLTQCTIKEYMKPSHSIHLIKSEY